MVNSGEKDKSKVPTMSSQVKMEQDKCRWNNSKLKWKKQRK